MRSVGVDSRVAVIGGGVVGAAVAHALARRGVDVLLLEAERGLALGASGANSGILHTGFDSPPGTLETRLILRAAQLREQLAGELGLELLSCGASLRAASAQQQGALAALADNARRNGVEVTRRGDELEVRGEAVTDPVAYVHALAGAAREGGAAVMLHARVAALARERGGGLTLGLADGREVRARVAVNCAGLFADEVARLAGESPFEIYPRKGEFLVFDAPGGQPPAHILLPLPSALGKGVLVFPTLDGHVIAGPTAREREDKRDWSVEADAQGLILERACALWPALAGARPVYAYAGLRPAGREGARYVIGPSRTLAGLFHVAAIRSTGLSASLAIGEHVAAMLSEQAGVELGPARPLRAPARAGGDGRWWERAASYRASGAPVP